MDCDGHDIPEIIEVLEKADKVSGKPVIIIARTVKGKCVSFAENICGYHGMPPKDGMTGKESLETALEDIGCVSFSRDKVKALADSVRDYQDKIDREIEAMVPKFSREYFWNRQGIMKVDMVPNRNGFGTGLEKAGKDPKVVVLGADISDSIKISSFYLNHPERKNRFFSIGIAEQNMTSVAAGFAKEGNIVFIGSYGVFCNRP